MHCAFCQLHSFPIPLRCTLCSALHFQLCSAPCALSNALCSLHCILQCIFNWVLQCILLFNLFCSDLPPLKPLTLKQVFRYTLILNWRFFQTCKLVFLAPNQLCKLCHCTEEAMMSNLYTKSKTTVLNRIPVKTSTLCTIAVCWWWQGLNVCTLCISRAPYYTLICTGFNTTALLNPPAKRCAHLNTGLHYKVQFGAIPAPMPA